MNDERLKDPSALNEALFRREPPPGGIEKLLKRQPIEEIQRRLAQLRPAAKGPRPTPIPVSPRKRKRRAARDARKLNRG